MKMSNVGASKKMFYQFFVRFFETTSEFSKTREDSSMSHSDRMDGNVEEICDSNVLEVQREKGYVILANHFSIERERVEKIKSNIIRK